MPNETTVGNPTIATRTALITVISPYTGDDNNNNLARLQWRPAGTGTWFDAFPMYLNSASRRWEGVIYGLQPSTDYDVRIAYIDTDGASAPWEGVVRTKDDISPVGTGPTIVVDPTSGAQSGVSGLRAGATLLLRGGTYREMVRIDPDSTSVGGNTLGQSATGSSGPWTGLRNPITIAAYPGEPVVVEGEFARGNGFFIGRYGRNVWDVIVRGLTVRNTLAGNVYTEDPGSGGNTAYITVEDCVLEEARAPDSGGIYGHMTMRGKYLIFRRNTVINTGAPYPSNPRTESSWKTNVQGIHLWKSTGGYHSVYKNIFQGGHYDDACCTGPEGDPFSGWVQDSEMYGNTILEPNDDGWQSEGGVARCVKWANTVKSPFKSGVGVAPVMLGPCYIMRNLFLDILGSPYSVAVKTGSGSPGKLYVVHNSFLNFLYGPTRYGGAGWTNQEYYNNIFWTRGYCYWDVEAGNRFDYNLLYTQGQSQGSLVDCASTYLGGQKFATLAAWQAASGQDLNSVSAPPLVDLLTGQLQPGSPAVDRAWLGWSEPFNGNGPDIGAVESGETASTYSLTTAVVGNGTVEPSGGDFLQGSSVPVVATAGPGWAFQRWEGDAGGTSPSILLAMDANKSITAVFVQLPAVLTIEAQGNGTTNPIPGTQPFPVGTQLSITAIPAQGWKLDRWELGASGSELTIVVTMDTSKTVRAVFTQIMWDLTLTAGVGGQVTPAGVTSAPEGSIVTITAWPDGGQSFQEWREAGVVLSIKNPEDILMDGTRNIQAVFGPTTPPPGEAGFTITAEGTGGVEPPYELNTAMSVPLNTIITPLAIPAQGWMFVRWEYGGITSTANPLVLQMNQDYSIKVVFQPKPPQGASVLPTIGLVLTGLGIGAALARRP